MKMKNKYLKKILLGSSLIFSLTTLANSSDCLVFQEGKNINQVKLLIEQPSFTKIEKEYGRFYSVSHDLNHDGIPEYFYYLVSTRRCGISTGCYITAYELINGKFRELIKYGLPTHSKFDPNNDDHKKYICPFEIEGEVWKGLRVKDTYNMEYNGAYYKALTKSKNK